MLVRMWRNGNPCCIASKNVGWAVTVENSLAVLQKGKHRNPIWSSSSTPRYTPKGIERRGSERCCAPMFTVALSTIAKRWKPPMHLSTDEWINKAFPYSGILFSHKKDWSTAMCYNTDEPWRIRLNERSQTQKDKYCMILHIWGADSLEKTDAGRDWGQEEKGTTEDEMAGWHHWLDGRESQWTPGVGDGQGGLACHNSWGREESDMTDRLIWSDDSVRYGNTREME